MKRHLGVTVGMLFLVASLSAGAAAARLGVEPELKGFPQSTPKETLASVLKAADAKRFDYLLAQLAEPDWVDGRVAASPADGFMELVHEASTRFDPPRLKLLRRFLEDGEIETLDTTAVIRLKDVKDRVVRLHKLNNRWYFRHTSKP